MATRALDPRHRARLLEVFAHLHAHPEISWQEYATRDYLLPLLSAQGCRIRTFDEHAGIVADWGEGEPRVGLRGDMDALWQEVDGHFCANHSCGHDAHMTIAFGTLLHLIDQRERMRGAVRLLFQPAEERGVGALSLVQGGAVQPLNYLFGVHVRPAQELPMGLLAPAGRPHLGANAIEVGAALVQALAGLHLDPMVPFSIKLTRFQAGGQSTNIIPGSADFSIDLRAQTNAQMERLVTRTRQLLAAVAATFGVEIRHELQTGAPAAEVSAEACEILAEAIRRSEGESAYHPPVVTGGGDDFHAYSVAKPELKATMLALGCDLKPGLHHPHMTFDHEAIFTAVQVLAEAVLLAQARC
jgi:amidohydrolase